MKSEQDELEDRIIELETKFAFQEDLVNQLNEALIGQQNIIDSLRSDLNRLKQYIETGGDEGIKDIGDETPPPHY